MFLWTALIALPWWVMTLWGAYTIYFICRAWYIWQQTTDDGLKEGYKYVFLGHKPKYLRLHHILRMIIDIPPALLGLLFPLIRAIFRMKIYEFKQPEKVEKTNGQG
ncbi:hypothetical protein MKY96_32970 [Paenibacillus sp. FSL R7-0302]|uniref:hypothetical protein n=1 Tax=Paenibacillus sp. FSL R7-0302 TaxID=2921681 RepID=UPI0030F80C6B